MTEQTDPILKLEDLRTYFRLETGTAKAVDGVNYEIFPGETLSVVGESGCGKSVTALSIMGLIPVPPGIKAGGKINFRGTDLLQLPEPQMRKIRGNDIAMIFQEPMTSLNPVFTVGDQIGEAVRLHQGLNRRDARDRSIEMLTKVGIPNPSNRVDEYPHQMSGGMRQRVMIAMALSCDPLLLIADEPTTALDVTIQAQILDLMNQLQEDFGTSILFITHDLGVVAEVSHHVAVMYAGKVVEYADVHTLYDRPVHPYTVGLFRSLPDVTERKPRLDVIPGVVPSAIDFPSGCRFRNRCPLANDRCADEEPLLIEQGGGHTVACHAIEEGRTTVAPVRRSKAEQIDFVEPPDAMEEAPTEILSKAAILAELEGDEPTEATEKPRTLAPLEPDEEEAAAEPAAPPAVEPRAEVEE